MGRDAIKLLAKREALFEDVEQSLFFLAESAEAYARATARLRFMEQNLKVQEAVLIRKVGHATFAERRAWALSQPDYSKTLKEFEEAVYEQVLMSAQRSAAESRIEYWRSKEASRRSANVQ